MLGEYDVAEQIHCVLIDEQKYWTTQAVSCGQFVHNQYTASWNDLKHALPEAAMMSPKSAKGCASIAVRS